MKKVLNIILSLFVFASIAAIQSCNSNPCKDIVCQNNGTCREGACACPSGFEGNFCQSKASDKFIGYWQGFKRVNGGKDIDVTMIIAPGDSPTKVKMYALSFVGDFIPVTANVNLTDIAIPQQVAEGGSNYQYRGHGNLEKYKYMHIWYEETDNLGVLRDCIFEGTKIVAP